VETAILTGLGLAAPAGLNAYIPLLALALADRATTLVTLEAPYDALSSNLGIAILIVLLTIEVAVDKIPESTISTTSFNRSSARRLARSSHSPRRVGSLRSRRRRWSFSV